MLPDDRRELWLLGLGLGLCADAGLLLAAVGQGWPLSAATLPHWAAVAVSVTTLGLFGLPLVVHGLRAAWVVGITVAQTLDAWKHRDDVAAASMPAEPEAEPDDRGWYLAIEITLLAGQVSGFTDDGLAGVMGSDARPKMQRFLAARGVLTQRPGPGYGWADGVTLADALRRLRVGDLAPFPEEIAPEVRAPVQVATRREAPRRAATAEKRVVEGVARPAD